MPRAHRPEGQLSDVQPGWAVYSADEEKVGSVDRVESSYLVAQKGSFFPQDLYIPRTAIRRIEHDRVYLRITKAAVTGQGWDTLPTETAGAAPTGWRTTREPAPRAQTGPATTAAGEQTLHLHEEQLRVTTERVPVGEMRVGKEVVEEQQTIEVPVTREELVIERIPGDRRPDDHPIEAHTGETIRVPLHEERVDVEKQTVMTEEVRVGKREVTEQRPVTETVRREEARIEETGNVHVQDESGEPRRRNQR